MISLIPVTQPTTEAAARRPTSDRFSKSPAAMEATWAPVVTLIVWTSCVAIGGIGGLLSYDRPQPPPKSAEPVLAELLNVELTNDPLPPPDASPPLALAQPPPLATPPALASAPPLLPVAEPSPPIAFALPVPGPVQVVEAAQASYTLPDSTATRTEGQTLAPEVLTHGVGEGRQPAPEYPQQARRSGQQGSVGIHFRVGPDGHVLEAEAAEPSPWPLLNQAAVRVVKERWKFRAGLPRHYHVDIRFHLQN